MKNLATILKTALFVLLTVFSSIGARAEEVDVNAEINEILAKGAKIGSDGFELPDPSEVRTYSNPRLRKVEIIQPDEYVEYEAAGQIPSPYIKNGVTQGWMVNGCVVIAPRHAIIGKGHIDKDLTNIEVDFNVGYQGKGSFKQQVKIKPIACGRGDIGDGVEGEDFCIYKANRSLKGLIKPIKIGAIDFQRYDIVPTISVGYFPQASGQLDVLAKDVNAKIVDGASSYLESRAANISGAGLVDINGETHAKYLIGLQVGYFKAVNSARVLQELRSLVSKNQNVLKCN